MWFANFLKVSLFKPKEYSQFKEQSLGEVIGKCCLFISIFTSIISLIFTGFLFNSIEKTTKALPKFNINNGILSVQGKEFVKIDDNLIIDLTEKPNLKVLKNHKKPKPFLLITKDKVYLKENFQTKQYLYNDIFEEEFIDNNVLLDFLNKYKTTACKFSFFILFIVSFLLLFIMMLIESIILAFIFKLFENNWNFDDLYKLCIVSFVPASITGLIGILIEIPYLQFIVPIIFVLLGIKNKKQNEKDYIYY